MDRGASIAISGVIVFVLGWIVGLIFPRHPPPAPTDDPSFRRWVFKLGSEGLGVGLVLGALSLALSVYCFDHAIVVTNTNEVEHTFPGRGSGWVLLIIGWLAIGLVGSLLPAMIRVRRRTEEAPGPW